MGIFDKKECAICGNKVGMLGARKVEDGTICSDCNKKLSPFFSERKRSTVSEIKQQLDYREQNKRNLQSFNATRTLGTNTKVIIDDNQRKFVVSRKSDFRAENADIIDMSQVTNVRSEIEEHREERYMEDANGNSRSYNPPQYNYEYEISIVIDVNSPYFSEIKFDVTPYSVDRYTEEYRRAEQAAMEIVTALGGNPGAMGGGMGYQQPMGGMGYQQQQPMGGYQQQQPMGGMGYQQPMQGGYQQQQPMGGYQQQQPMQGGYQQQQPMGGYQQQQPMQGGYQQQAQAGAQWFCPNCGTPNTSAFCQNCGTPKA